MIGYLLTPPSMLPEQPPVSTAVLKSYLEQKRMGHFRCIDLSLEFFYYLTRMLSLNSSDYDAKTVLGIKIAALDYINNTIRFDPTCQKYAFTASKNETSHWAAPFPFSYSEMIPYIEENPSLVGDFLQSRQNLYVEFTETLIKEGKLCPDQVDFVGFSLIGFFQVIPSLTIACSLKRYNPHIKVCFGGPWVTLYSDKLSALFSRNALTKHIDYFSIAEGEYSLEKIIAYEQGAATIEEIPNTLVKIDGVFTDTGKQAVFSMEDSVLPPDYRDFDLQKYFSFIEGEGRITVQSSRGCYHHKCSFCNALTNMMSKRLRQKNIDGFIQELDILAQRHPGVKIFDFADSVSSQSRLLKMAAFFQRSGFQWEIDIRLEDWVDDRLICAMHRSKGLLRFGLEAVSQRLLDLHSKGNEMPKVIDILERCKKYHYKPLLMSIVGLPSETKEDAKQLEEFLLHYIDDCIPLVEDFNLERNTCIYRDPSRYGIAVVPGESQLEPHISFERKNGYTSREEKAVYTSVFMRVMEASLQGAAVTKAEMQWEPVRVDLQIPVIEKHMLEGVYNGIGFAELNPHFKQALYSKGIFDKNMAAVLFDVE